MKKIIIAPDSYKESLPAIQICQIITSAFQKTFPACEILSIPFADGGEGTCEAIHFSLGGQWKNIYVNDPLYRPIQAQYVYIPEQKMAIIEMAKSSGLPLLKTHERNPMITSSYGTGEIILDALQQGATHLIIGIGGSATNDGGIGMMRALGVEFLDSQGHPIPSGGGGLLDLNQIDTSRLTSRLSSCHIQVACDVTNPLCGPDGASYIFGPQKGATENMLERLDQSLYQYASILKKELGKDVLNLQSSGAAGGMGAAFYAFFPNIHLRPGIDIICDITRLNKHIQNADLVITGEGRTDKQTLSGKAPMGVQKIAAQYDVPIIGISGSLGDGYWQLLESGFTSCFDITTRPENLKQAIKKSEENLYYLSLSIAQLLKIGR